MIKSNELRVGNWVYAHPTQSNVQFWEGNFSQRLDTSEGNKSIYELIEPIPLTEDWLQKFGFEKAKEIADINNYDEPSYHHVQLKGFSFYLKGKSMCVSNSWCDAETEIPATIEYVHQLQNLYFALTGKELTLK